MTHALPLRVRCVLPFTRRELPGWGWLLRHLVETGPDFEQHFRNLPPVTLIGKWHRYRMTLNLADWAERRTWYLSRYYELATQLLLRQALRPGDRFIDIGANIGMISLLAAKCVGPHGRVDAFEPNPHCAKRIADSLVLNDLHHVAVHNIALGKESGQLTLTVLTEHTGTATLAEIPDVDRGLITRQYDVRVLRGDDVLKPADGPAAVVKIDVEGFECRVIDGLTEILRRDRPLLMTEVVSKWLERAGDSASRLFQLLDAMGYQPWALAVRRNLLCRYQLCPQPLSSLDNLSVTDVVWTHKDMPEHRQRLGLR
ncbi:MAG: FkbM family methyltransferase [Phycisphaeraceae bacterium]|nr:FkbM family methyltransferase [Phycisphaeraceae bacterium]